MLDDDHIRWLANALAKNQVKNILLRLENKKKLILAFKTLKSLNLYGNIITEQGAEYLSNALKSNKVRTSWGKTRGEKQKYECSRSHCTPTVLPWYSHGTPMILPNTSMVLPGNSTVLLGVQK